MKPIDLSVLGGDFRNTGRANQLRYCCPFCVVNGLEPDTSYHLYVNTLKGVFHCFRCTTSGKIKDLHIPMHYHNEPREKRKITRKKKDLIAVTGDSLIQQTAFEYWKGRGLTKRELEIFGVKFNPVTLSLVFPVLDENGKYVFDVERKVIGHGNPYYIESGIEKKNYLYNLHQAKHYALIYIVEGVFDVIAIGKCAVCLLGKYLSEEMIAKLRKTEVKYVRVLLDKDAKRESRHLYLGKLLPLFYDVKALDISTTGCKDIAELREKQGYKAMRKWLMTHEEPGIIHDAESR